MINAKTLDANFLTTLVGAGLGASALEGDGDIAGAAIGLGVGAFTGSKLNFIMPKFDKYVQRNQTIRITDKPVNELERIRQELSSKVRGNFDFLPSDNSLNYDKNNLFNTLSNENIRTVISESTSLSELKTISSIIKNENNLEKVKLDDLTAASYRPKNAVTRSSPTADVSEKTALLSRYFQDLGYKDQDLAEKLNLFSPHLESDANLVINLETNTVTADGRNYKISSNFSGEGGISSHTDGSNYSAVRRVNPFADMYLKDKDRNLSGRAIAQALGINFADAAKEAAIGAQIEKYMLRGAKPEDIKALLGQSENFSNAALDSYLGKAYEHLEYESGFRVLGESQRDIETKRATDLAQRLSKQTSVHQVISLHDETGVNTRRPFRNFSNVAKNESGSDLQNFISKLGKELGIDNLQPDIKADHANLINTYGTDSAVNPLAPAERSQSTTGSRTNPININKNSRNNVVKAFEAIREKGLVPREYATSSALSRITVDADAFNLVSNFYNNKAIISLGDGSSLGKRSVRKDYTHKGYKKYDIYSKDTASITLSDSLKSHVIARENLGIDYNAPELETKNYLGHINNLESVKKERELLLKQPNTKKLRDSLALTRTKQKRFQQAITAGENIAKNNIESTLKNLAPESGNAKALQSILDAMAISSKDGARKLEEYNNITKFRFSPDEVLGLNANGEEVRLSKEFKDYKIAKVFKNVDSSSNVNLSFVFEGNSDTGFHDLVKDFGTSGKESVKNLEDDLFNRAYGIASFLNKTGYTPEVDVDGFLSFNKYDAQGKVTERVDYYDVVDQIDAETAKAYKSGTAMITDTGGAGQKLSTQISGILNGTITKETLDDLQVDQVLKDRIKSIAANIPQEVAAMNLEPEDVIKVTEAKNWSLGQLATSLTEGKATSESVMGLGILGMKNLNLLADVVENDLGLQTKEARYASKILENTFGSEIFDVEPEDFRTNLNNTFMQKFVDTKEAFSSANLGRNVVTGDIYGPEIRGLYDLAYMKTGESTHLASADINSGMRTGSDTTGKNISHSAQLHLKLAGATAEDLATYGKQSAADIYDLRFITDMGKDFQPEQTINEFLDTKSSNYKKNFFHKIARSEPEQINDFLISEKVPQSVIDQDFLYYKLENSNEQGIKTVPIHKHSTTRVGSYEMENGKVITKKLQGMVMNLVESDINISRIGPAQIPVYEQAAEILKNKVVNNFVNPNNPQMKGTLAIEVPNSVYAVSKHASSTEFDNIVKEFAEQGASVIGVTRESAVQNLRGQGLNVTLKNLNEFIDDKGLLLTELTDGSLERNISLQNREPALSADSTRHVFSYVMDEESLGEKGSLAVYHSSQDKHYTKLMYGDFDMDHTLVYNSNRKLTREEYQSRANLASKLAEGRNELIELNEILSIKGKNSELYSMDSLVRQTDSNLKELGLTKNTPEYFEHLVSAQDERLQAAFRKGGARKAVSPGVTQMSVNLAENIYQSNIVNGVEATAVDKQIMGTIGHSLVENLLKMQHIDTDSFRETSQLPVEKLLAARSNLARSYNVDTINEYKSLFRTTIKSMFGTNTEQYEKYKGHAEAMLEADVNFIKDPSLRPSNTMEISKNIGRLNREGIATTGELIEDIASGANSTQLNALPMDTSDINIERSMKVGYNDLLVNAKQNLIKNKFPLMVGAGGLALGALITQKDPNFQPSKKARADTGSMMLAPNVVSQEQSKQSDPMILQNLGRVATDYIGPETSLQDISHSVKQTVKIQGSYQHFEKEMSDNMKEAIFGNNISNVRIEREYD